MDEKYKEALNRAWSLREDGYKNKDVQETVEYIFPQLKQEQTEELSTSLNGLMQEYVKSGKDEEEQEHRLKCYQLFWDALGDSEFFKQKEHKPVVTHGETYHVDTLGTQQVIAGKMPQKPTEWSEEDEKIRQSIIKDIEFERNFTLATTDKVIGDKVIGKYNEQINWLKSIPLNLKKKNEDVAKLCSNEWSKEDEKMRELLIAIFEVNHPNGFFKANEINTTDMCGVHTEEIISWLKSLHPQKLDVSKLENFDPVDVLNRIKTEWPMAWEKVVGKQEWDEEDEIELNDAIKYVQNYGETSSNEYTRLRTKEIVEWLKSIHHPVKDKEMKLKILKYLSTSCSSLEFEEVEEYLNNLHPSWKPSEEQMEALDDTIFFDKTVFRKKKLVSLLEDLKKLI